MKLTVGPLPAGVYWRRRAIIGGALLILVLLLWAQCSGPDPNSAPPPRRSPRQSCTTAEPRRRRKKIQDPHDRRRGHRRAGLGRASSSSARRPRSPRRCRCAPTPTCSLVAGARAAGAVPVGAYLKFTLKIKNTSARECTRDLGADFQELLPAGRGAQDVVVGSLQTRRTASQPTTLKPTIEVSFSRHPPGTARPATTAASTGRSRRGGQVRAGRPPRHEVQRAGADPS